MLVISVESKGDYYASYAYVPFLDVLHQLADAPAGSWGDMLYYKRQAYALHMV